MKNKDKISDMQEDTQETQVNAVRDPGTEKGYQEENW